MPIRWRLTVFNALAIGGILLLLGLSLFLLLRGALLSGIEDSTRSRAYAVARVLESGEALDEEEAERLTLGGVFIIVRDGEGLVVDQTTNRVPQEETEEDSVSRQALETGEPAGGTENLSPAASDYVYAVPVDPPSGPARVVEAGRSYESAAEVLATFAGVLAIALFAALVLSIGGAYLLARAALSPVDAVVDSARQITEGNLSKRLPVTHPKDEIGRLTTTINEFLGRLEGAFARREEALSRQRRFTADASHELRTPLTSIAGYTRMLEDWGLKDPEIAQESVAAIKRESERMRELSEGLLTLARGDEGAPMELCSQDLGAVSTEAVEAAQAAANGKVAFVYTPPDHPVDAPFDRARIRQVITILLDNAIKYTPEGGKVTVEAREEDDWARLEVSDTGIGVSEEQLPLIFERFHRADPARTSGGAGLGLSIACQIARAHGGEIEAKSTPGEGSTFVLRIPRSTDAS